MLRLVVAIVALMLASCGDEVTEYYATKRAATDGNVVARGWLPLIIPESSFEIHMSNDLDLNVSDGSFKFAPEDWPAFSARLTAGTPAAPFAKWEATLAKYRADGYRVNSYTDEETTWAFFCRPTAGWCEYLMWLHRDSAGGRT